MKTKHQRITTVILENFKAFGERVSVPVKPLTVLSGLNSSGKSSIYQSLLLLKQSRASRDAHVIDAHGNRLPSLLLNGEFVQLGTPQDILHNREKTAVTIGLRYTSGKEIVTSFAHAKPGRTAKDAADAVHTMVLSGQSVTNDKAGYTYAMESNGTAFTVTAKNYFTFLDYDLRTTVNDWIAAQAGCDPSELPNGGYAECVTLPNAQCVFMQQEDLSIVQIAVEDVIALIAPDLVENADADALTLLMQTLKERAKDESIELVSGNSFFAKELVLERMKFIPPFRGFPERLYNNLDRKCFVHAYEKLRTKSTAYLYENGKPLKATFRDALNYWIGVFLGEGKTIKVDTLMDGLVQAVYLEGAASNPVPLNNLGFGISQILPIVYECLSAGPGTLLVIDEPETHLHPSMQSKLADFLVQMARLGRDIIVETHSEYILDKLIYHCIKTPEARDVTELYWVKNSTEGSAVTPIEYDDLGYVSNAPDGFLSEKAKLVEELTDLRLAKLDAAHTGAPL